MKIGRCAWQGATRLARIDEGAGEALLVAQDEPLSANPVLDVIERRVDPASLRVDRRVPLRDAFGRAPRPRSATPSRRCRR